MLSWLLVESRSSIQPHPNQPEPTAQQPRRTSEEMPPATSLCLWAKPYHAVSVAQSECPSFEPKNDAHLCFLKAGECRASIAEALAQLTAFLQQLPTSCANRIRKLTTDLRPAGRGGAKKALAFLELR